MLFHDKKWFGVTFVVSLIFTVSVILFYTSTDEQVSLKPRSPLESPTQNSSGENRFKSSTLSTFHTFNRSTPVRSASGSTPNTPASDAVQTDAIQAAIQSGKALKANLTQALQQPSPSANHITGIPRGSGAKVLNPTQQAAVNTLLSQLGEGATLNMDAVSGTLRQVDGNLNALVQDHPAFQQAKRQKNFARMAVILSAQIGTVLGLENPEQELAAQDIQTDELGFTHVTLNQQHEDIPVWGAQLKMHFNGADEPYQLSGVYAASPWQPVVVEEPISKEQATLAAQQALDFNDPSQMTVEHMIYWDIDQAMVDTYKVELADLARHWVVFVSRADGQIIHQSSRIYHQAAVGTGRDLDGVLRDVHSFQADDRFHMIDTSLPMFDPGSNPPSLSQTNGAIFVLDAEQRVIQNRTNFDTVQSDNLTEWDPFAVSLQHNFRRIEDYYRSTFNRNSIDNRGLNIVGIIHARFPDAAGNLTSDNAFWNFAEKVMVFGDGDRVFEEFTRSLDVAGHELTHGVIDFSAGLIFENQPGALNEHLADFFGTMIDRDEWLVGDGVTQGFLGLRDLQNPANPRVLSRQPTRMSEFQSLPNTPQGDFGGVHINSGIPNRMSFLLAEGPQGIGKDQTERIIFRALTVYLTRRSQFIDYRRAVENAARDLHGENSPQFAAVQSAFDEVGITGEIAIPDNSPTPGEIGDGENLHAFLQARPELGTNPNTGDFFYGFLVFNGAGNNVVTNRLLINSRPAFSGDGSWALFVDQDFNLILIRSDLSEQVIAAQGNIRNIALSKDQRFIAFNTTAFDNLITIIDMETTDPDREVRVAEIEVPLSDGSLQAVDFSDVMSFNFSGDALVFDALTTSTLSSSEELQSWSLYKLRISDLNVQSLIANSPREQFGNPVFAQANNDYLLADWIVDSLEEPDVSFFNIVSIDLNENVRGTLQEDIGSLGQPTWNGSDDEYLFVRFDPTTNRYLLLQAALSEDKLTQSSAERTRFSNMAAISFPIGFRFGAFAEQRGEISVPNALTFSNVPVNEQTQNTLVISNTGSVDVELIGVSIEGEAAAAYSHQAKNQLISPGEEVRVPITFAPIQTGENEAVLVVHSSDVDRPRLEVRLNGVGTSQTTAPSPTPTSVLVGSTPTPQPGDPTPFPPTPIPPPDELPTPRPSQEQILVYEFEQDGLQNSGWETLPGGFTGAESGRVETVPISLDTIPSSADQRGLKITVEPGQVAFIFARQPFLTNGNPVLIRASIRSDSENAAPALVAISGDLGQSRLDGSLATLQPSSLLAAARENRKLVMLYEPDRSDIITPAIQVASTSDTEPVTVWVDQLELRILFPNFFFEGRIFESDF